MYSKGASEGLSEFGDDFPPQVVEEEEERDGVDDEQEDGHVEVGDLALHHIIAHARHRARILRNAPAERRGRTG